MKTFSDPFFITYCLLWAVVQFFRQADQPLPWLNGYLTDFLFVPAVAHLSLHFIRKALLRNNDYRYPLFYVLCMALYAAVVFEYLAPRYSAAYTGDWGDVAAYFLGAVFFYFVHQGRRSSATI